MTKQKAAVLAGLLILVSALTLMALVLAVLYGSALWDAWGLRLRVTDAAPDGLTLHAERSPLVPKEGDSSPGLSTGNEYFLEIERDGAWAEVPPRANADDLWELIRYRLPRGMRQRWEIGDLEYRYGTLPAGRYRIGKIITLQKADGTREERAYYAEFTLKE